MGVETLKRQGITGSEGGLPSEVKPPDHASSPAVSEARIELYNPIKPIPAELDEPIPVLDSKGNKIGEISSNEWHQTIGWSNRGWGT